MDEIRARIISTLSERLRLESDVLAVWLEGADAVGRVDEYSDIDLVCAVAAGRLEKASALARAALESLGPLDLINRLADHQAWQAHTVFHLDGTPAFLLVDFVAVEAGHGSQFVSGDEIEKPLVLFDRGEVIQTIPQVEALANLNRSQRIKELHETVAQCSRIEKYVQRGEFLEAFGYYHKWLLLPLIEALRLRYTPLHPDYYIVHISRHLPADVLVRLEGLFKIGSIEEIGTKSKEAIGFFEEIVAEVEFYNSTTRTL